MKPVLINFIIFETFLVFPVFLVFPAIRIAGFWTPFFTKHRKHEISTEHLSMVSTNFVAWDVVQVIREL